MDALVAEFSHGTWLPFAVIVARLVLATLLGASVGLEREWRRHSAGLRTHMLVCLASATVAILAIEIVHSETFSNRSIRLDPIRLIEAVTGGVAFLVAGLIVFARGEVRGLTTGAGLWLAGAIGLACGLGLWQIAVMTTLLGIAVIAALRVVESRFAPKSRNRTSQASDHDDP